MRVRPACAVAACAALLLAACGASSDEDRIRSIVETAAADPASICGHLTDAALRDLGGREGCERLSASEDNRNAGARVESVAVDGDTATARITGGPDGPRTQRFVKEDGEWRLDPG